MSDALLFDEFADPPVKQVMGVLMASARLADFAAREIRLAGLEVDLQMLRGLKRCRFLVGHLDLGFQSDTHMMRNDHARLEMLRRLDDFAASGRLEVRSGGVLRWSPDFSIYSGLRRAYDGRDQVLLIGAHYFERPYAVSGAALTALLSRPAALITAQRRFEELWEYSHDVLPVVMETIEQLLAGTDLDPAAQSRAGDPSCLAR